MLSIWSLYNFWFVQVTDVSYCSTILNDIGWEGTTDFSEQSEKQRVRKLLEYENTATTKVKDETNETSMVQ